METFGERLKNSRKEAKLSQVAVASRIGVSQGLISDLENDVYDASVHTIALAQLYRVNPYWLATGTGCAKNQPLTTDELDLLSAYRKLPAEQQSIYRMHMMAEAKIREAVTTAEKTSAQNSQ